MSKLVKIGFVIVLLVVVGAVIAMKGAKPEATANRENTATAECHGSSNMLKNLPRLVDLGAGKCIPCKMMALILEELRVEYAGKLRVDVHDVWENPAISKQFGIRIIPTQIFYDSTGKELWRHEGYMSKHDILAKWKELGVDLSAPPGEKK